MANDPLIRLYSLELQLFNKKRSFTRNRQNEISAPGKMVGICMEIQEKPGFRPIRKEQESKKILSLPFGNLQAKISLPCVIGKGAKI